MGALLPHDCSLTPQRSTTTICQPLRFAHYQTGGDIAACLVLISNIIVVAHYAAGQGNVGLREKQTRLSLANPKRTSLQ